MTSKQQRRDDFVRFNLTARNFYASVKGKNTSHMRSAWVKEWRAADWKDLPDSDRKTIADKVRMFKRNVLKLGRSKKDDENLAVESISILRNINTILQRNRISVS